MSGGVDSRLMHFVEHTIRARVACTPNVDDPNEAAKQLGTGLHPLQDWVAHGDYGIRMPGAIYIQHNSMSPQHDYGDPGAYPDSPGLDAVGGPDGRAAGAAMHYINNAGFDYAIYKRGTQRLRLTKAKTDNALTSFWNWVKANGGCKCKKYFGAE